MQNYTVESHHKYMLYTIQCLFQVYLEAGISPSKKRTENPPQKIRNVAYIYTVNKTKYLSSLSKINPKSKGKYNIR